jgi:Domain of unknown function (DUF4272)
MVGTDSTRQTNYARLRRAGFRPARGLPRHLEGAEVRPTQEIAARLLALISVFSWVTSAESTSDARVRQSLRDGRERALTRKDRAILALPRKRAHAKHVETIGWSLENMWPLAWALGMRKAPRIDGRMIDDGTFDAILDFAGSRSGLAALVERARVRSLATIAALEDLFYCAHNAVRSAQLGASTVPKGFNPFVHGGVTQERRHALTWILSPGTKWDDTDLST